MAWRSAFFVLAGILWGVRGKTPGCHSKVADIVFVLDESGSIYGEDFTLQLKFVKDVSKSMGLGEKGVHVGVLTFSDVPQSHIDLTQYYDQDDFNRAVDHIKQKRGKTNTYDAISLMRTKYFGGPDARKVPHVAIIITDGSSSNMNKTISEANSARADGIEVFAIGVSRQGHNLNMNELRGIANKPSGGRRYLYLINDYKALDSVRKQLTTEACKAAKITQQMIEGCKGRRKLDVVFSIPDQAGVMGTEACVDFISSVSAKAKISQGLVQLGVSKQFCNPRQEVALRHSADSGQWTENVEDLKLKATNLEDILKNIRLKSFRPQNGARQDSVKVAVLIVDNKLADTEWAYEEAEKVKAVAEVMVIGVTSKVNMTELAPIASSEFRLFHVKSYDHLSSQRKVKDAVGDALCRATEQFRSI